MTERKSFVFSFADIEVREREFCIVRDGEALAVEPKAFRVLLFLLRNPQKLITKDELLDAVWTDTAVSENSLTRSIAVLRKALGDDTHEPRYIATVPTVGYRFLCDVRITEDGVPGANPGDSNRPPEIDSSIPASADERVQQAESRRTRFIGLPLAGLLAVALGILVAGFLIRRAISKPDMPGSAVTHLASEQRITSNSPEAAVKWAIVSPDGKYLAYADPTGLYLRVIASGETRRWTLPKDFIANPNSWFPDGTHLLVTRVEGPMRTPSLWKLSLLGTDSRKLIDNAGPGWVSPDGTRIALLRVPEWGHELWVMDSDGSNPHKIASADQPEQPNAESLIFPAVWSPNGQRVAYIERHTVALPGIAEQVFSLRTRDTNGGDLQVILNSARLGPGLAWAPDGRILYASQEDTASDRDEQGVRSIRVDEHTGKAIGQPHVVTSGAGVIGGMSLTADGRRLVLWRTNTQVQAFIAEFDVNTRKWKTPRRLTLDANGNIATGWMSDSKTVLFVSDRNGTWTLFKQGIDETTAEVLVEGRSIFLPRLSADGSQVLYESRADPVNFSVPVSLMRLPVASGPPQLVLKEAGIVNYQCARLPSTLCIFNKLQGNDQVFVSFDPERGVGRELLRTSGRCVNWSLSPDAKTDPEPLWMRSIPTCTDWSLSPDGRTLAVFSGDHRIQFYSVGNGVSHEGNTVTLNDWRIKNGDWSADGKGLLVQSTTLTGTPVILEVDRAGKVSVVLEGDANSEFWWMVPSPDGRYGLLGVEVPGDNNAWIVDKF